VQILSINTLLDEWQNRQILRELQQKIDRGANQIVVDLGSLSFVNSAGINFLLSLFSKTQKEDGQIILANASMRIQKIMEITKLSSVFTIKNSIDAAVNSLTLNMAA
jgi:anti-anti-sigma factor